MRKINLLLVSAIIISCGANANLSLSIKTEKNDGTDILFSKAEFDEKKNNKIGRIGNIVENKNHPAVFLLSHPDENGISHNYFDSFSVGKDGISIYNYPSSHRLFGDRSSAKTIIIEVIGKTPSKITGKINVLGRNVDLIIANSNGISCINCQFYNIYSTTLSAANIANYDVKSKDILFFDNSFDSLAKIEVGPYFFSKNGSYLYTYGKEIHFFNKGVKFNIRNGLRNGFSLNSVFCSPNCNEFIIKLMDDNTNRQFKFSQLSTMRSIANGQLEKMKETTGKTWLRTPYGHRKVMSEIDQGNTQPHIDSIELENKPNSHPITDE